MTVKDGCLSVKKTVRGRLPRLPFASLKRAILGERYTLSVVFIGDKRARALNKKYRKKEYIPDILSFPLSPLEGEMFINQRQARRRAKEFEMDTETFLGYLLIHGLLHLKGLRHGSRMEQAEQRYLKRFFG
ncbi:rRNA maturation RNase YbeY [Candidatus Kaiserbacteria bacterium]|nr:rRNA maturation RNase YbeY [Candidatus Kaiserbacteria bacterium]